MHYEPLRNEPIPENCPQGMPQDMPQSTMGRRPTAVEAIRIHAKRLRFDSFEMEKLADELSERRLSEAADYALWTIFRRATR